MLIPGRNRAFDLPGHFRVTLFWPDDLGLVKAGPDLRRRFLNHLLVQIEPGYAQALGGLKRVLEQRNHLLKRIAGGEDGRQVLDAWDGELVKFSQVIVTARAQAVRELAPHAALMHAEVAERERLDVQYLGPPDDLAGALGESLPEDLRRGSTSAQLWRVWGLLQRGKIIRQKCNDRFGAWEKLLRVYP